MFYAIGDKVTNESAFTNPIGIHFPKGSVFTVEIGGHTAGRSIALRSDQCGARVWISDGLFLTSDK